MSESVTYRRSNLREALMDRAMTVLQERGEAALSLRELARDLGVSHTAPARHFPDRGSLIEALIVEGFRQLRVALADSTNSDEAAHEQAKHAALAYLEFTDTKANVADVMFRHEVGVDRTAIGASAAEAFAPLLQIFQRAQDEGALREASDAESSATLFLATLQGLAALTSCGVIAPASAARLAVDAVPRFVEREQPAFE